MEEYPHLNNDQIHTLFNEGDIPYLIITNNRSELWILDRRVDQDSRGKSLFVYKKNDIEKMVNEFYSIPIEKCISINKKSLIVMVKDFLSINKRICRLKY